MGLRLSFWTNGGKIFLNSPLVGSGVGAFESEMGKLADKADELHPIPVTGNAHNDSIMVAAQTGLLGLSLWLVFLIASDIVFSVSGNASMVVLAVVLFGLHLGATQGIFSTIVAQHAKPELRATAFGVFNFFSGLAIFISSVAAGALWDFFGAAYCFAAGAALGILTLVLIRFFKLL